MVRADITPRGLSPMPLSFYDVTVPTYVRLLEALKGTLDKAAAHARAAGYEEAALLDARLFPDMWPLKQQVQAATNHAFRGTARLAGLPIPTITDASGSFADLHKRIDETLAFVRSADRAAIDGAAEREITVPMGKEQVTLTGLAYFQGFSQPNFYFHLTTAYDILRHNGVPLTKSDFTGKT
jgi:hypothetical protein